LRQLLEPRVRGKVTANSYADVCIIEAAIDRDILKGLDLSELS